MCKIFPFDTSSSTPCAYPWLRRIAMAEKTSIAKKLMKQPTLKEQKPRKQFLMIDTEHTITTKNPVQEHVPTYIAV